MKEILRNVKKAYVCHVFSVCVSVWEGRVGKEI